MKASTIVANQARSMGNEVWEEGSGGMWSKKGSIPYRHPGNAPNRVFIHVDGTVTGDTTKLFGDRFER